MSLVRGASRPLEGRRVVVTRAAVQQGALSRRLAELGADVVELPLIRFEEPPDGGRALREALGRLASYDWVVVTSPNGAERVGGALSRPGAAAVRVAAVGSATAAALGRPVDLVPARQVAEGLVDVFPRGTGRVLLAQAEGARPALAEGLGRLGWDVEAVVAYRTVPTRPHELPAGLRDADAMLLSSGSTARAWRQVVGEWAPAVVVAIGPQTAAAAEGVGLKVTRVASDHSLDGLVDALVEALGAGR